MNRPKKPSAPAKPDAEEKETRCLHLLNLVDSDCIEQYEEKHEEDGEVPAYREWGYHETFATLKELIEKVPEGMDLGTVKVEVHRGRYLTDIILTLSSETPIPIAAAETSYEAALEQYKADIAQYELDLAAYREFEKQEEIRSLEDRIAQLRK